MDILSEYNDFLDETKKEIVDKFIYLKKLVKEKRNEIKYIEPVFEDIDPGLLKENTKIRKIFKKLNSEIKLLFEDFNVLKDLLNCVELLKILENLIFLEDLLIRFD